MNARHLLLVAATLLSAFPSSAVAQEAVLLRARAGSPTSDRIRVDSSGAFTAYGFVRDVGNTTGCAAQLNATGAGTRFMWIPCRGSVRFGRVPVGQTNWDDSNMDDFTFAGGNQATASDYAAFAYGDLVTASATAATVFGYASTVSGTAGFSAGASNVCSGFACTAIGYTVRAGGQGSVALGYRTTANNDYSVALGYRASNNTHTGTMVMGDESTTDSVRNQADNEFRIRYNGGIRLRVSTAANGNTPGAGGNVGCDLTVAVPSWTCASSRTVKQAFIPVNVDDVLDRLMAVPVTTWSMLGTDGKIRHMGPMAEDFYSKFQLGLGETTISMGDFDGVNMAAIQALAKRGQMLEKQVRDLQAERDALEARLKRVEELLQKKE